MPARPRQRHRALAGSSAEHRRHQAASVQTHRSWPLRAWLADPSALPRRLRAAASRARRPHHTGPHRGRPEDRAARELGDLSENGDYHAAKDEQGHMEGRIRQLESILEHAEIVERREPRRRRPGLDRHDRVRGRRRRHGRAVPRRPPRGEDRRPRRREPAVAARCGAGGATVGRRVEYEAPTGASCGCASSRWSSLTELLSDAIVAELATLDLVTIARLAAAPAATCSRGRAAGAAPFVREIAGPPGAPTVLLLHGWTATADLNFYTCYEPLASGLPRPRARPPRPRPRHPHAEARSGSRTAPTTSSRCCAVGHRSAGHRRRLLDGRSRRPAGVAAPPATRARARALRDRAHFSARYNERLTFLGLPGLAGLARLTPLRRGRG